MESFEIDSTDVVDEARACLDEQLLLDPLDENNDSTESTMTVAAAATLLGKSPRQIQRMLKQGVLKGYKTSGSNGLEWRVQISENENSVKAASNGVDKISDRQSALELKMTSVARELQVLVVKFSRFETEMLMLNETVQVIERLESNVRILRDEIARVSRTNKEVAANEAAISDSLANEIRQLREGLAALSEKQGKFFWQK